MQGMKTRHASLIADHAASRRTKVLQQVLAAWRDYRQRHMLRRQQMSQAVRHRSRRTSSNVLSAWQTHTQVCITSAFTQRNDLCCIDTLLSCPSTYQAELLKYN